MKSILLTRALLFFGSIMVQSSISGRVTDTRGNPIAYANIQILNSDIGTATDTMGNFGLRLPAVGAILKVSVIGYATLTYTPSKKENVEIVLIDATQQLDDIVVTAQKREEKLVQTPVAVSSISAKKVTNTYNL